jgi:hypothetical protein
MRRRSARFRKVILKFLHIDAVKFFNSILQLLDGVIRRAELFDFCVELILVDVQAAGQVCQLDVFVSLTRFQARVSQSLIAINGF